MHMKTLPTQHPPSAETQRSQAWVPRTAQECQTRSQGWLSPSHPPGPSSSLYCLLGFLGQLGLGWVQVLHRRIHSCSLEGAMHPRRSPDPHIFCLPPWKPRGCSLWVKGAFPHIFAKWRRKEFLWKQVSCGLFSGPLGHWGLCCFSCPWQTPDKKPLQGAKGRFSLQFKEYSPWRKWRHGGRQARGVKGAGAGWSCCIWTQREQEVGPDYGTSFLGWRNGSVIKA